MNISHRALMCLGYIVKVTVKDGRSTMGRHRPCDIRELFRANAIMRCGRERVGGRIRNTYWPTQEGHEHLVQEWSK